MLGVLHLHGEAPGDEVGVGHRLLRRVDDAHLEAALLGANEEVIRGEMRGDAGHGLLACAVDRTQVLVGG